MMTLRNQGRESGENVVLAETREGCEVKISSCLPHTVTVNNYDKGFINFET